MQLEDFNLVVKMYVESSNYLCTEQETLHKTGSVNCLVNCCYKGFTKGVAPPFIFQHKSTHIQLYVHGSGFVVAGDYKEVKWLQNQLSSVYDMKSEIMGDGVHEI